MVYAGVAVGRWRPFEKHKRWSAFARLHCALEQVETVPAVKGGMIDLREVRFLYSLNFMTNESFS